MDATHNDQKQKSDQSVSKFVSSRRSLGSSGSFTRIFFFFSLSIFLVVLPTLLISLRLFYFFIYYYFSSFTVDRIQHWFSFTFWPCFFAHLISFFLQFFFSLLFLISNRFFFAHALWFYAVTISHQMRLLFSRVSVWFRWVLSLGDRSTKFLFLFHPKNKNKIHRWFAVNCHSHTRA